MGRVKSFRLRRGRTIGDYSIRERLGRGWEGEVYRVREKYSQSERVLKLFDYKAGYRFSRVSRFCRKYERLTGVNGVIRFHHGGWSVDHRAHYIVMEYVPGKTLERFPPRGGVPVFRALRIVRDILRVVDACHARQCRVGDIAPENIIIGSDDRPYIIDLDFGKTLTRSAAVDDVAAVCKLFYFLTKGRGAIPADLRRALPKKANVVAARYKNAKQALAALHQLTGI